MALHEEDAERNITITLHPEFFGKPRNASDFKVERLLSRYFYSRFGSLCDRQLSKVIAVKQPVNFRFPKTAFR